MTTVNDAASGATIELAVGCTFAFDLPFACPAVFLIRPEGGGPRVFGTERFATAPSVGWHDFSDEFGNMRRRMTLPAGRFELVYEARMHAPDAIDPADEDAPEIPVAALPDDVLQYTMPSRFCHSDVLADEACRRFGGLAPGWSRVQAVVDFVHEHLVFGYGSSTARTTAGDALASGRGVCRDYAHLAATFLRGLNIPARYAFGYLPDIDVPFNPLPMDFCAWIEVYLGDRWWTFDPRNNDRRKGRLVIGRGRDAVDVAMTTTYGTANLLEMTVRAELA